MSNYSVESILDMKIVKDIKYFLIKWQDYDVKESTWEPLENLSTCPLLVKEFYKKQKLEKEAELDGENSSEKDTIEKVESKGSISQKSSENEQEYLSQEDYKKYTKKSIKSEEKVDLKENKNKPSEEEIKNFEYGKKILEGTSRLRVIGVFRESFYQHKLHFKVEYPNGHKKVLSHATLLEIDPMSMLLFYEKHLKLKTSNDL